MQIACGAALLAVGAAIWLTETIWSASIGFAAGLAVSAFYPDALAFVVAHVKNAFTWIRARGRDVVGVRPVRANKAISNPTSNPTFARANGSTVTQIASNWLSAIGNVAGFLLRYWKPLALICLALAIMGVLRGCHFPFVGDLGKSRGEIILERDLATRRAEIATKFGDARVEITRQFDRTASSIERDLAIGTEEIEDLRDAETTVFLLAWAAADRRLCNSAGPCGNPGA